MLYGMRNTFPCLSRSFELCLCWYKLRWRPYWNPKWLPFQVNICISWILRWPGTWFKHLDNCFIGSTWAYPQKSRLYMHCGQRYSQNRFWMAAILENGRHFTFGIFLVISKLLQWIIWPPKHGCSHNNQGSMCNTGWNMVKYSFKWRPFSKMAAIFYWAYF